MQKKLTPKISIVIPIYNVSNFLNQTLFSVVNQTLKNIEIICIEDCSTDNSAEILKTFARTDDRIKLIQHSYNKGVSISRKEGILASTGDYVMFLDGDDYLDVTACKALYNMITKREVDMLQFGSTVVPTEDITEKEIEVLENLLMPYLENLCCNLNGELVDCCFAKKRFGFTLWNKIYRGDITRNAILYYPDERFDLAEDLHLFFLIAFFSKKYASTSNKYYFYNFGMGITGRKGNSLFAFNNKIKQGRILSYLKMFVEKYDPMETTRNAIETIQNQFISDVLYNLIWGVNNLGDKNILEDIFANFDKDEILTELLYIYYSNDYKIQKEILCKCKKENIFACTKNSIKTIGTFYYRLDNGGVERVISKLIPIWLSQGYQVVLFTDEIPSPTDYDYSENIIRVILPQVKEKNKKLFKKRITYLHDMLERYNIDVMVYHAWISEYLFMDMLLIKSLGIPFIVHTHSFFAQGLKSGFVGDVYQSILINKLYNFCDAIITLSKVDYNWWSLTQRNVNVYKTINPLSFELKEVKPSKLEGENILWIGRLSPEKRPIDALKIMKEVVDNDCNAKLHFVGKADNQEYYQLFLDKIVELGLENKIVLHGFHKDVKEFYENSSVYLHTSEFEGFSMTLVESKAYGVPAVVYELPNLDIVQNGDGMKIVQYGDIAGAAKVIIELLRNDSERFELGKVARKSIEKMYTLNIPELWEKIFNNIAQNMDAKQKDMDYQSLNIAVEMMLDFTTVGIETREIKRNYQLQYNCLYGSEVKSESERMLEEIYGMRTWRLIQKYRKFMDETLLGKILSRVRNYIVN